MNRVLIVDADPGVCQGLQAQLEQRGVEVLRRPNVNAALELLDHEDLDCVVTGLDISEDGDLCNRIASSHAGLPVVMATEHIDVDTAVAAMRMGASDVIQKPIALDALCSALDRASSRRKRRTDGEAIAAGNDVPTEGDAELVPLEEIERRYMQRVLNACRGNKTLAAKILQVNRRTLARKFGGPVRRAVAEG